MEGRPIFIFHFSASLFDHYKKDLKVMGKSHFKSHVVWFLIWDAGYSQVSGADQVIVPITNNLQVPIR